MLRRLMFINVAARRLAARSLHCRQLQYADALSIFHPCRHAVEVSVHQQSISKTQGITA
jgi:hypothetical protein